MEKIKVHIISPKDNWILQKIGSKLQDISCQKEITYYINWIYWKLVNNLKKSNFDAVLFTHFEGKDIEILRKADLIICMSLHGKKVLLEQGIENNKIEICPYFGISVIKKKKIAIGTSGRNYNSGRKNRQELDRLKKDLDSSIFEFKHSDITDDKFFTDIDYFLQTSTAEGGSMDILNAIYNRTPVVSRNIGFIYTFQTDSDFIYNDYGELLLYFKTMEKNIKQKDEAVKNCTWDNFRKWHIDLFNGL